MNSYSLTSRCVHTSALLLLKSIQKGALCAFMAFSVASSIFAEPAKSSVFELTHEVKKQHIEDVLNVIKANYVRPDSVPELEAYLTSQLRSGKYRNIKMIDDFITAMNDDIYHILRDTHMSVYKHDPTQQVSHIIQHGESALEHNFAFEKASVLAGNIGYLKFNKFHPNEKAIDVADHALQFVRYTDALIIDLRHNGGGSPWLVQNMLSYFFEENTVMWTVQDRAKEQVSEHASLAGKPFRFPQGFPVYILTSPITASASEIFTSVMQANARAVVVGSKTGGAAYLVGARRVNRALNIRISLMQPIVSATGSNWEAEGIQPDLPKPVADALDVAVEKIKQRITNTSS